MAKEHEILNEWGAEIFVGDNYDYYKNKWQGKPPNQTFSSWNFVAFFFPVYWMAYRKMYVEAFICVLIYPILYFTVIGSFVLHIVLGVFGNSIYRSKGIRVIKKSLDLPEDEAKEYIRKHGGTSALSVVITIVLIVFITVVVLIGMFILFDRAESTTESTTISTESAPAIHSDTTNEKTYDVTTKDGEITFTVPVGFVEEELPNQDLRCYFDSRDLGFSAFIYHAEDYVEDDARQTILLKQVEGSKESFQLSPLTEVEMPQLGDDILQEMYLGIDDGLKVYFYFAIERIEDYYVLTAVSILPSKWNDNKELFGDIVSSARLADSFR